MASHMQIWQEEAGKPSFRIQTVNEDLHQEMLQSDRFNVVAWGVNIPLWIHRAEFQSVKHARQTFERYFGKGVVGIIGNERS